MKLYDIPQGSKIKLDVVNHAGEKIGEYITFHHLDGMYSYCTVDGVEDSKMNLVHLAAATPLVKVGDHYEIESKENIA